MRRSMLFIPGNAPGMVQNADVFGADSVIFDLEDAVLPIEKDAARQLLSAYFHQFPKAPYETVVRINSFDTQEFIKDLELCLTTRVDTIMIPKASMAEMKSILDRVNQLERLLGILPHVSFIPIIETTTAVFEVAQIASSPRVSGLLLGGEDFATDLGVARTPGNIEILVPRSLVAMAAKANKIDAIDTPFLEADQEAALYADASFARSLGMNAKACIHPLQVDTVNKVFSPTNDEILHAQKLLAAEALARKEGRGAFSVDGKMVDKPILERAHRLIQQAKAWGLL